MRAVTCFDRGGGWVIVTASNDNTARVWDLESGAARRTLEHPNDVSDVACWGVAGGWVIVSGCKDNNAYVWDGESGAMRRTRAGHTHWGVSVACAGVAGGWIIASAGWNDKTARLWDGESGAARQTFEGHTNDVKAVDCVVVAGELRVVTGSEDNTARVWSERGALLTLEHAASVRSVAGVVAGDAWRVVSGDELSLIHI